MVLIAEPSVHFLLCFQTGFPLVAQTVLKLMTFLLYPSSSNSSCKLLYTNKTDSCYFFSFLFFLKKPLFLFACVYVCTCVPTFVCVCMYMCTTFGECAMCVGVWRKPEEGFRSPKAGVTGGCELYGLYLLKVCVI